MAVKEQNRFSIGRIGVANADRSGEILNRSIANNAAQIVKTIEPLALEQAKKRGVEEAESVETSQITGIDPNTGLPIAYRKDNFQIDNQVYNEIIKDRFQDEILKEIKIAASDANTQTLNSPNRLQAFTTRLNSRLSAMSENAKGWAKQFIDTNGADYLAQTAKSIERQVAAQARQKLAEDTIESYNEKLITIQTLYASGQDEKAKELTDQVIQDAKRDRSQNIISEKNSANIIENAKISSIPIQITNKIFNRNIFDFLLKEVRDGNLSFTGFREYREKIPFVLSDPLSSTFILNDLNEYPAFKPYVAYIKNITKGLSGKEFLKLGEISKDILGNAKRDIGLVFDNTFIQIEEERQVSKNLIDHTNKIVNSKEFEKSISNDLTPEKINQFFEGYETITNTFVDSEKNEFFRNIFSSKFEQAFSPLYVESLTGDFQVTSEVFKESLMYVTRNGPYQTQNNKKDDSKNTLRFINFLKERGFSENKIKDSIFELSRLTLNFDTVRDNNILDRNALNESNRDLYTMIYNNTVPYRSMLQKQRTAKQLDEELISMNNALTRGTSIPITKRNSELIQKLNIIRLKDLGIKNENDLYNYILSDEGLAVQGFVDNEIASMNLFQRPPDKTFIDIFQDLANGQLSGKQLKNATEIYTLMRDKVDADGNLITRFSNEGDGIDDDTYATLEALHIFKEVYGDRETYDDVFVNYNQSLVNAEASNILARKLNIDVRDNPKAVNDALNEKVREYLIDNYSPTNIERLTKVMSARARAFMVREGQPVETFEAVIPVLDKYLAKEYPSNLGVIYDPSLQKINLNSKYSPIKAYGTRQAAVKALGRIEEVFQTEPYIKYFNKYHDGKIPTFDIDNAKEKELSKSFTERIIIDGVRTYLNTPLDLLGGLITVDGAINRFQTYGRNILDLVGLEDREDYFGPIMQLTPINVDGAYFEWRVMVQDFVGSEPYFIPIVDQNGDPNENKETGAIMHAQIRPASFGAKEKYKSFIENYTGETGIGIK